MKTINFEGQEHQFPDDFSDEEISSALGGHSAPSATESFGRGMMTGATANFYDELSGVARAGGLEPTDPNPAHAIGALAKGAYRKFTGDPEAQRLYDEQVAKTRAETQEMEKAHPVASAFGNVAGAVALPGGAATQGATLPARMLRGSLVGAGYGALYGAGAGETPGERAVQGIAGAGAGATLGAAAPPIVEGAGKLARSLAQPAINTARGFFNPEAEASRRVLTALERDRQGAGVNLTPAELATARQANVPLAIGDLGGETTHALARSSANTSPTARQELETFTSERFGTQNQRASDFIDRLVGGDTQSNFETKEALKTAARKANRPAYKAAYEAGDREINSPELERLSSAPYVQSAIGSAISNWKNFAVRDGYGAFNPSYRIENGGLIKTSTGLKAYPNIQLWDYAARELQNAARAAPPGSQSAMLYNDLARQVKNELDTLVPEYRSARQGAASFFGAQDALDAGKKFVASAMENTEARAVLAKMNPAEKKLFQQGYAAQLIDRAEGMRDRANISNLVGNSPKSRERLEMVFGPQRARELETYLQAEGTVDRLRTAVKGNSSTVRQLAELGLAGGAYGAVASLDPTSWHSSVSGLIAYGLAKGHHRINEGVARRVGQMLVSDNPDVLSKGIKLIARAPKLFDAFRRIEGVGSPIAGMAAPKSPMLQASGTGHAEGNSQKVEGPVQQQGGGGVVDQHDTADQVATAAGALQTPMEPTLSVLNKAAKAQRDRLSVPKGYASGGRVTNGRVSTKYHVRSGAVASKDHAGLVYIDPRIPAKDRPYLVTHELAEKAAMAKGKPYEQAHDEDATPAERAHVEHDGKDWRKYTEQMDGYLDHIEHRGCHNPPPDPHIDPNEAVKHHRSHTKGFAAGGAVKMSKADAHYRDRPKAAEYCARCTMFRKPHTCTAVEGKISSLGWCRLWARK